MPMVGAIGVEEDDGLLEVLFVSIISGAILVGPNAGPRGLLVQSGCTAPFVVAPLSILVPLLDRLDLVNVAGMFQTNLVEWEVVVAVSLSVRIPASKGGGFPRYVPKRGRVEDRDVGVDGAVSLPDRGGVVVVLVDALLDQKDGEVRE